MAIKYLTFRSMELATVWMLTSTRTTPQLYHARPTFSRNRTFTHHPVHSAPPTLVAPSSPGIVQPKNSLPSQYPIPEDADNDNTRHAAFLGEADSNDGHDAHRDAHGPPEASLDASNSAFLGEADSNDGFETHRDSHGRPDEPVDATHSAFLGEADSDDGFEGRRAAHPEEGDHGIEDPSFSGDHGQSGEGDLPIEQERR